MFRLKVNVESSSKTKTKMFHKAFIAIYDIEDEIDDAKRYLGNLKGIVENSFKLTYILKEGF